MKKINFLSAILFTGIVLIGCSNDDDTPQIVNEEEVITTLLVTLTPNTGGTPVTLQTRDLDGDGPNAPVVTVSGPLATGVVYNSTITLLNETVNPAENITDEVEEESDEHQFFYTVAGGLDVTTTYFDFDTNENPLGTKFILTAGAVSSGTITFTLRHEPKKPNTGLADAGGETDFTATFSVSVN